MSTSRADPIPLAEAAADIGLDPGTLRCQVHAGRLAARKIGRNWVVERAELERYRRESLGRPGAKRTRPRGTSMETTT